MVEKNGRHSEADASALEPFFAAARDTDAGPSVTLLSAILADAGEVSAERRAAEAVPAPASRRSGGYLRTIGGWRGLTALAACAALGFWLGIAGEVSIDTGQATSWSSYDSTADGSADDQVGAFFDLASVEG